MQDSPLQQCHICFSSMAITLADVGGTDTLLSTRGRFVGWPTLTDLWTCNAVSPALRNSCRCDVSLHHFQLLFKQSRLQRQQKLLGQMRRGQPTAIFVHPVLSPAIQSHTHTHAHPFNGPLSRTTRVSRYQKGKTNLDFTEARDSEWQWHQLGHMQVCTSLQTNNHGSTPPPSFYRPDALCATQPTASKHWRQGHCTSDRKSLFCKIHKTYGKLAALHHKTSHSLL